MVNSRKLAGCTVEATSLNKNQLKAEKKRHVAGFCELGNEQPCPQSNPGYFPRLPEDSHLLITDPASRNIGQQNGATSELLTSIWEAVVSNPSNLFVIFVYSLAENAWNSNSTSRPISKSLVNVLA
jgi:hypothetical protein